MLARSWLRYMARRRGMLFKQRLSHTNVTQVTESKLISNLNANIVVHEKWCHGGGGGYVLTVQFAYLVTRLSVFCI